LLLIWQYFKQNENKPHSHYTFFLHFVISTKKVGTKLEIYAASFQQSP